MRTGLLLLSLAGYIHVPPATLRDMVKQSGQVRALTVKARDAERGAVTLAVAETLRAHHPSRIASFRLLVRPDRPGAKAILDRLAPGAAVVLFSSESDKTDKHTTGYGYAFIDDAAFSVDFNPTAELWLMLRPEPTLSTVYHGPAKGLPALVKDLLAGKDVKVPTRKAGADDHRMRALLIDEARRHNHPTHPRGPLPTAWGKPVGGLQAGLRLNPAYDAPTLEVVVRTVGPRPATFTHLDHRFTGVHADGVVALAGKATGRPETRAAILVSPGDAYPIATVPVRKPAFREGLNHAAALGVVVRPSDDGSGDDVTLDTGYLDVPAK